MIRNIMFRVSLIDIDELVLVLSALTQARVEKPEVPRQHSVIASIREGRQM